MELAFDFGGIEAICKRYCQLYHSKQLSGGRSWSVDEVTGNYPYIYIILLGPYELDDGERYVKVFKKININ